MVNQTSLRGLTSICQEILRRSMAARINERSQSPWMLSLGMPKPRTSVRHISQAVKYGKTSAQSNQLLLSGTLSATKLSKTQLTRLARFVSPPMITCHVHTALSPSIFVAIDRKTFDHSLLTIVEVAPPQTAFPLAGRVHILELSNWSHRG